MNKSEVNQILQAIEDICGDDFCEDLEMRRHAGELSGPSRTAAEKLAAIYRVSHAYNPRHSCYRVHGDWRKLAMLDHCKNGDL